MHPPDPPTRNDTGVHQRCIGRRDVSCRRLCLSLAVLTCVTPCEGDSADGRVLGEVVPDLGAPARRHVDEPRRETGLVEALHHVQPGDGALSGGLEDDGVSCHEGGAELGDGEVDGVVERRDAEDHAQGHPLDKS